MLEPVTLSLIKTHSVPLGLFLAPTKSPVYLLKRKFQVEFSIAPLKTTHKILNVNLSCHVTLLKPLHDKLTLNGW